MKKKELEQEVERLSGLLAEERSILEATSKDLQKERDAAAQAARDHREEVLSVERHYEAGELAFRQQLANLALGNEPDKWRPGTLTLRHGGRPGNGRVRGTPPVLLVDVGDVRVAALEVLEARMDGPEDPSREPRLEVTFPSYGMKVEQVGPAGEVLKQHHPV